MKKLKNKYPNIILIITREGKYSTTLKNFVKSENITENVIFTGDVDNPFIPLKICDIFLWPWLGEVGFGLALLEAMLMGKPIIATSPVGHLCPIENEENGLLIEPNEDAICNAVIKLLNDEDLIMKIGKNAQKLVSEQFTWERCVENYLTLYNNGKIHKLKGK